MDCEKYRISCALDEVARAISDSDANTFWLTLLATLVGAAAAGAVSIALYRHELKTRKRGEIDVAVSELIREVQKYSQSYSRFVKALRQWQSTEAVRLSELLTSGPRPPQDMPETPAREGIDTAVEMLIVLTDGEDRRVAERCREVLYELTFLEDFAAQRVEYASVRRVLVAWRARKRDTKETIANLDAIDERRRIIETGSDERLPDTPEPFQRTAAKQAA